MEHDALSSGARRVVPVRMNGRKEIPRDTCGRRYVGVDFRTTAELSAQPHPENRHACHLGGQAEVDARIPSIVLHACINRAAAKEVGDLRHEV
jgi:hypothetical protein